MSTVQITRESHEDPFKFRVKYEEANEILGPNETLPENNQLPVLKSSSKIAIIGGGFGGLACALSCIRDLKEQDFTIFDKHSNFGGTWYSNTYPGCASDIPAVWYSFFSELNNNWSALRPPQYEMEEYIMAVVNKYGLKYHARFRTSIVESKYDDKNADWTIYGRDLNTGQRTEHKAKILVMSQGGLVYPNQLKAPGLENFKGDYMHSALWKHDVSFKGKDVIIVGNGCSANQVVPALLDNYAPKSITQVVRSKHFIMPPLPKIAYSLYRLLSFSRIGIIIVRWIIATVAEMRYPLYNGTGIIPSIVRWINTRNSINYMKNTTPKKFHDVVIPNYKIGCKRIIYDYTYLPSLHDPRMDVTDDTIDHIEEHHVVLKSGRRLHADVIVACTGYDLNKSVLRFLVIGSNGVKLQDTWGKEGASAYETILVKYCPNLFVLGGPNSATGHSSVVLALENGCAYFTRVAKKILSGEFKSVRVDPEKYDGWNTKIQAILKKQVFGTPFGGCVSWYTADGRNATAYPYSQITYWWRMRHPKWNDLIVEKDEKKTV